MPTAAKVGEMFQGKFYQFTWKYAKPDFETVLESLPEIFQNAEFIAFDTEFTGLKVEGASSINYFDTLEDLYLKDRLKVETFLAIQFGVTIFFHDKKANKYTYQSFNFYIYPSSYTDVNFTCQNRSIEFLVKHGFDFNKLFKEGIPYLNDIEVEKLLQKLEEKVDKNCQLENSQKIEIPSEHKAIVNEILKKVRIILQSNSKKSFTVDKQNSFVRKLIYNSIQGEFGSKVLLESNKDETMTVLVGYTDEELKEIQNEKFLLQKKKILDEVGFTKVIKLIMDSKKLLVGHNLLLDILFTIKQFLSPLPYNYNEFKELVHFLFPKIIDTKYMASICEFKNIKDTSLYALIEHFAKLKAIPEVEIIKNGKGYNLENKKLHEAAYDAYLTGLCFLSMSNCLGNFNCNSAIFNTITESPFLEPILNKLSVPKLCDISYMNIGGYDNKPDRLGVYHLIFPKEWTRDNIMHLFKDFGFINISWINNTSAFIKVKREYISEVEKNLMNTNSNYKLCSHSEFKNTNQNMAELLISPLMERRLGSSLKNFIESGSSPLKLVSNEPMKKRRIDEDVGEVIERPQKKQCAKLIK